ncbi:MAG TPA: SDR family NAD(P)-dependent oxidoreductase [Dehalococcoidia bacterium]|nr:SDR family NAD(P)-dependent oxidoreductase [Dehalococcoidia bacterium]
MGELRPPGGDLAALGLSLAGRAALVSGAARGVGRTISARFVAASAAVALADIDAEGAAAAAADLVATGGRAIGLPLDVTDPASWAATVEHAVRELGRIDILVNNAGITGPTASLLELDEATWRRVLAINLDGVFFGCRAVLPHLLERGSGRIINVASIAGKEGNPNLIPYSTSKAGVIALTKALAKEVARTGILINAIAPAVIGTELLQQMQPETIQYMVDRVPMGRMGTPEEAAALVHFLASDACTFSTGFCWDLSGGRATY